MTEPVLATYQPSPPRWLPWMDDAVCDAAGADLWFADDRRDQEFAAGLCRICPARLPCLAHALDNGERYGVWGGTTPAQRKQLRRKP